MGRTGTPHADHGLRWRKRDGRHLVRISRYTKHSNREARPIVMRTPFSFTWLSRLAQGVQWRLPILLLATAMVSFYVAMPYRGLDADVTTFGLMGNDLLRHGYLPTLTYGQNYLFSITPYLYALVRLLFPSLSAALALTIAGAILSVGGLWLIYEALLTVEHARSRRAWPPVVFCLLIGSSWTYIFDISRFSSIEIALFLLGVVVFSASRIEKSIRARIPPSLFLWGMLGAAGGHALYSRPQMAIFAALAAGLLLTRMRPDLKPMTPSARRGLAGGVFIGYLPMLLHHVLRAGWPFHHHVALKLGTWAKMSGAVHILFTEVLPRVFEISWDHRLYSAGVLFWIVLTIILFILAARYHRETVSAVDWLWAVGSLISLAMMILAPRLSIDAESRRYCLQVFPGVVWLFARLGAPTGRCRVWNSLLVGGLVLLATPQWVQQFGNAREIDQRMRAAEKYFIPYLRGLNAPILAQYWDAYLLAFLADGSLRIDAYPWNLVRTYSLLHEEDMHRRTVWLVKQDNGGDTWNRLTQVLGPDLMARIHQEKTPLQFLGYDCEVWEFDDSETAVNLMKKYQPLYFSTWYPPSDRVQWMTDGKWKRKSQ